MDHKQGSNNGMRLDVFLSRFLFLFLILFPSLTSATVVTSSDTVSITAIVGNGGSGSSGSGGGGGGGSSSGISPISNTVLFRGFAYPGSIVTLLKDGAIISEIPASPDATFQISLAGVAVGTYNFGIRAQDSDGGISTLQNYTIIVSSGITTIVSGIILPPTISIDKSEIKRGDILTILGKSVPSAEVSVVINSENNIIKKTVADVSGGWVYKLDTLELEYGDHQVKARGTTAVDITPFSQTLAFKVGLTTKTIDSTKPGFIISDLDKNGKVNIADFSLMAYWYKRSNPPANADMNHDGKIDLVDFSILAYYWTG